MSIKINIMIFILSFFYAGNGNEFKSTSHQQPTLLGSQRSSTGLVILRNCILDRIHMHTHTHTHIYNSSGAGAERELNV